MEHGRVTIFHIEIPLKDPFVTAGGFIDHRSVALVRVGSEPYGWGEAAPYPGQDESIADLLASAQRGESTRTLAAAIDEATADREAKAASTEIGHLIGAQDRRPAISVAVGLDDPLTAVEQALDLGVSRFKLKVAPGRIDHVSSIRNAHPRIAIGVDANGSFSDDSADELGVLAGLDVSYIEQPIDDMAAVGGMRLPTGVPIFADESVRSLSDGEAMLALDHVDGVVVKPGRLGWSSALAVRRMANAAGKLWRASGLLETGIGRAYTNLLAGCPDAFISDVAPADWFLESDIAASSEFGVGVEPDMTLVDNYLVEQLEMHRARDSS